MPGKDDLDRLLDSALATYGDPGDVSALEQRVLASLAAARAAEQEHRDAAWPRRWLGWAIAAPVAASLLLWIAISRTLQSPSIHTGQVSQARRTQTPHVDVPANEQRLAQQDRPSAAKAHLHLVAHTARLKPCPFKAADLGAAPPKGVQKCRSTTTQVANKAPLPKLDVFPTPQPLTPQERALAVVATQGPVPLRKALAEAQIQDDAPVRIAAIHIPPIELPSQTQP